MRAGFTVTMVDGTVDECETTPLSVVETERKFDIGVVSLFVGTEPRLEALFWLMWRSLHPAAPVDDDNLFMQWLAELDEYDVDVNAVIVDDSATDDSP